jgi:LysM repeat protein
MRSKLSIAFCALLVLALPIMGGCGSAGGSTETVRVVVTPVPSPTLPPEAVPTLPPVTYTVKTGDTLSGIADLFGVTVDDIVRANNIADPNSLALGQVLIIPGRVPTPAPTIAPSGTITTTQIPATGTITATTVVTGTATNVLPPPDVTPPLGPTIGTTP